MQRHAVAGVVMMRALRACIAGLALLYAGIVGSPAPAQVAPGSAAIGAPIVGLPTPDFSFDFGTATYSPPFSPSLSFTRAGPKTNLFPTSPPGFVWQSFANDVMVTDPVLGMNTEFLARTNYYPNSTAPAASVNTTSLAPGDYTLWITSADGKGAICLSPGGTALTSNGRLISKQVDPAGDLGKAACARQNASITFQVQTAGTVVLTKVGSVQTADLENGLGGTSFIVTGADPVTRATDRIGIVQGQALYNALTSSSDQKTIILTAQATEATPYTGFLLRINNGMFARGLGWSVGYSADSSGGNVSFNTAGSRDLLSQFKVAIGFNGSSGRRVMVNGGNASSGTRLITAAITADAMNLGGTSTNPWMGWVRKMEVYSGKLLPDWLMRERTRIGRLPNVIVYGDSLSARAHLNPAPDDITIWSKIEALSGGRYRFLNAAREGDQFAQGKIAQADVGDFDKVTVIFLGSNVGASASVMMSDLATMVSLVKNGRYLIVSAFNSADANGQSGGANWSIVTSFNSQAAALYGTKFLDLGSVIVASGVPGDGGDADDASKDWPVRTTRAWTYRGALTAAMDATQTSWSMYTNPPSTALVKIENEYVQNLSSSGATVTNSTRGALGSAAVAHPQGATVWSWDILHQSNRGVTIDAQQILLRLDSLYGTSMSYGLNLPPTAINDNEAFALAA